MSIKKKYRDFFIKKELEKVVRRKKVMNYYDSRNIGIIYDASIEDNYLFINNLIKQLQQDGKKVDTLGFIRQKNKHSYSFPRLMFGFFSPDDYAWNFKIKTNDLKVFVQTEFDILIDLSPSDNFYTKYAAGLSKALYKTGAYNTEYYNIYDLLIDVGDNCSIEQLAEHFFYYLKTLKNEKTYA